MNRRNRSAEGFASQIQDKFMVRLPGDLRDRIKHSAQKNGQSMTAAVVLALEAAFPAPVEPESPNEALLRAAEEVIGGWSDALRAMGVDPEQNEALSRLRAKIEDAVK